MLGALDSFFFALIVVIMRHVEPKAEKTMIKKKLINNKGLSCYNCSENAAKRKNLTDYCIMDKNLNPGEHNKTY